MHVACLTAILVLVPSTRAFDPGSVERMLFGDGADTTIAGAFDLETRLYWLSDSLRWAGRPGLCEQSLRAPFELPPRPSAPVLGVVFADGRRARWDPLLVIEGQPYWSAERACAALGATLRWAPGRFAGALEVDTLTLRFAVGSEFIHDGGGARQLTAPVRYERNRLLFPADIAARVVRPLLGHRFAVGAEPPLIAQRPLGPLVEGFHIVESRGRTALVWTLPGEPRARLRADGVGRLAVDLEGAFVDPLAPLPESNGSRVRFCAVRPHGLGTEFVFEVPGDVKAWESEWRAGSREYRFVLSPLAADLGRGSSFRRWPSAAAPPARGEARRRVYLVPPGVESKRGLRGPLEPAVDQWIAYICALADRLADRLRGMGLEVRVLEGGDARDPSVLAARANADPGLACLILRPDICGDRLGADWRIVTAMSAAGARPLAPLDGTGEGAPPPEPLAVPGGLVTLRGWEQVVPQHAPASEELAWLIARHLGLVLGGSEGSGRVSWQRWPTGLLEGLDQPAAALYIGAGPAGGAPGEDDGRRLDALALALALALDAFGARLVEMDR